ncbi:hypothetical protein LX86_001294 [Lentzea aerocolonigenes]|nr:hypothetical protein [Lentzea aerocolonigenes]
MTVPCTGAQGFLFHSRLRQGDPLPSDVSSAGIARVVSDCGSTNRKNVLGRVQIPIMPGAATWTRPATDGQWELGQPVPAARTGLARRVPTIDHDKSTAGASAFVLQLTTELTPAAVMDGTRKTTIAHHGGNVEVFDHDHVSRAHQSRGCSMQKVLPRVADLALRTSDLDLRLAAVQPAALTTRHPSLVASEVPRLSDQMPRILDAFTVAGDQVVLQTQVNTDRSPRWLVRSGRVGVHGERHVPTAIRVAGHDDHRRFQPPHGLVGERPHEMQRLAALGEYQHAFPHAERRTGEVCTLATTSRLEPREASTSGEEVLECGVLVTQRLLQRHAGNLRQEGKFLGALPLRERCISLPVRGTCTGLTVAMVPLAQGLVPHQPHTAERTAQQRDLIRSGVSPALVRRSHDPQHTGSEMTSLKQDRQRRYR